MSEPIIMPETLQPYHPENNPIGFIKEKSEYDKAYYKIMRNTALFLREKKLKEEAGEDVSDCVKIQKPYPQIPRISSIYEKKEPSGTLSTDADSQVADVKISDKHGADERGKDARRGRNNSEAPKERNNSDEPGCDATIPTVPRGRSNSDARPTDVPVRDATIRTVPKCRDNSDAPGCIPTAPNPSLPTPNSSDGGLFIAMSAKQWVDTASLMPDPKRLYGVLWNEGELCCLFGDSNCGKSIFATQIAIEVSKRFRTLYFDFEMSCKQFQLRYTDEYGEKFVFPDNFIRLEMDPSKISDDPDFEKMLISEIKKQITIQHADVVIIDNLSFICLQSESGDAAGRLMRQLKEIQVSSKVSILVLGHTPKRDMCTPITQNELAGSKRLFNFFDSVFAIGVSARDHSLRYLKQLKVRADKFTFTSENVLTSEIIKDGSFLHFKSIKEEPESTHLRTPEQDKVVQLEENIIRLYNEKYGLRQISRELGASYGKVQRVLKRYISEKGTEEENQAA